MLEAKTLAYDATGTYQGASNAPEFPSVLTGDPRNLEVLK